MFRKAIFVIFLSLLAFSGYSQISTNAGTDFWFAFPECYDRALAQYWVNITSDSSTTGTVSIPGTNFTQNFSVAPGGVARVDLPSADATIIGSDVNVQKAIHVTSANEVTVFAITFYTYRHEASLVLPTKSLGTTYRTMTHSSEIKSNLLWPSEFSIVATGDTVVVDITPTGNIAPNRWSGQRYSVTIPPNYVYQGQALSSTDDLTGSLITSTNGEKFAVYSGNVWSTVFCTPSSDPLIEAMFPTTTWGSSYFVIPTPLVNIDYVRIMAHQDTTRIYENGTLVRTINAGQFYSDTISQPTEFTSNKPTALSQFLITGQSCATYKNTDPSMTMLNPTEQMFLDSITFFAVDTNEIDSHWVHVITRVDDTSKIFLDSIQQQNFSVFSMNGNYAYKTIRVDPGYHRLETTGCGFLAYSFGIGYAVSYAYAAGVSLIDLENSISYENFVSGGDTICQGDTVKFKSLIRGDALSYSWNFGDGGTDTVKNPVYSYANVGQYEVTAVVEYACQTDTLKDTVVVPPAPLVQLGNDTMLCKEDTIDFRVSTQWYDVFWSDSSTNDFLKVEQAGTYWIRASNYCGVDYDTINIDSVYHIKVELGNDTVLCIGQTLALDATSYNASYQWQDGGTQPKIVVDTTGIYHVQVSSICEVTGDTINVQFEVPPTVDLGPDTVLCITQSPYALNAAFSRSTYLWHDGSGSSLKYVFNTDTPWVQVTNLCGVDADTVAIFYESPLQINLGNDTLMCRGSQTLLDPLTITADVLWHDGSSDTTFVVTHQDTVWVKATNACGAYGDTMIALYEVPPSIHLRNDTLVCQGTAIPLSVSFSRSSYLWSNGATTSQITAINQGVYQVTATNLCGADSDQFTLTTDTPLTVTLGSDTLLCDNQRIKRGFSFPNQPNFTWSTGATSDSIEIFQKGIYQVSVSNTCGVYSDAFEVYYNYSPQLIPYGKVGICEGESAVLSLNLLQNGAFFNEFLWSDSTSEEQKIFYADTSQHWVRVDNYCGSYVDSFEIFTRPLPRVHLGVDTLLCDGESISYDFPTHGRQYYWQDGTTLPTYTIRDEGEYRVFVTDQYDCEWLSEITVSWCEPQLFVPSAFTPNIDAHNEGFRAYSEYIYNYKIEVFDRWGDVLFQTNDITEPWDGTDMRTGEPLKGDVYSYRIQYNRKDQQLRIKTGTVLLIR